MLLALGLICASGAALADLKPWKDYTTSDAVWWVTTIKVHSNMGDAYLEGLRDTWVASNEVAKKLGQIEEYHIYESDLPESGSFNVILAVKVKNLELLAPNKARFEAFMKEWGAERDKKSTETAQKEYPAMRDITGEYFMHEITLSK
jgi:hypothetical protein